MIFYIPETSLRKKSNWGIQKLRNRAILIFPANMYKMIYGGLDIAMLFFPNTQRGNFFEIHQGLVNKPDDNVAMNFVLIQAAESSVAKSQDITRRFC